MIKIYCDQYSPEWWDARVGIPTASVFSQIITSTGKPSASAKTLAYKLAAERITGKPDQSPTPTDWMERGKVVEVEARLALSFLMGEDISQVGLVYKDEARLMSCSPDGLCKGFGVEIKCPSQGVQMKYLYHGTLPSEYVPQVYGSLYICEEVDNWKFFSYHPDMPHLLVQVDRDEKYRSWAQAFETEIVKFCALVSKILKKWEVNRG